MYCVKASNSRDFDGATQAIVNKSSVKVAGITIEPLTGLLLPQNAAFITEYEESGDEIKRQLEKGARNGTRNDQKIATQLVDFAQKMMNPQTMQRIQQIKNAPQFGNLMRMLGM